MATRKVQLYLTDEQYRYLRQRAGERGSIAGVVRDLIDRAGAPQNAAEDPFYRHLLEEKEGSGQPYRAEQAKRELYRQVR